MTTHALGIPNSPKDELEAAAHPATINGHFEFSPFSSYCIMEMWASVKPWVPIPSTTLEIAVVMPACDLSTWEVEAGRSEGQGQALW